MLHKVLSIILLSLLCCNSFARKVSATVTSNRVDNETDAGTAYSLNGTTDTLSIPVTATAAVHLGGINGMDSTRRVTIIVEGYLVISAGDFEIANCKNVNVILRDPTHGYGIYIPNSWFRAFFTVGILQNVRISGLDIYNPADYACFTENNATYGGNRDSASYNVEMDSIRIRQAPSMWNFGNASDGKGYWIKLLLHDIWVDSIKGGDGFYLGDCFDVVAYNIHGTNFGYQSTATFNNAHYAFFNITGNGIFCLDYLHNFWGDFLRAHGCSLVPDKTYPMGNVVAFNNIATNSTKYGFMEGNTYAGQAEGLPNDTADAWKRPANYYCYNNTVANLRDIDYWVDTVQTGGAVIYDNYYHAGACVVINNLVIRTHADSANRQGLLKWKYIVHQGDGSAFPDTANNVYSADGNGLVIDTILCVSKNIPLLMAAGSAVSFFNNSYNGVARKLQDGFFGIGAYYYNPENLYIRKTKQGNHFTYKNQ